MKFRAKTIVSLTIKTDKGNNVRVSFDARTSGGSYYKTNDEGIIYGLKNHPDFGKSFTIEEEQEKPVAPAKVEKKKDDGQPNVVKVASVEDAKEYLVDKFEISRTQLRSLVKIKEFAASKNIVFEGL